MLAGSRLTDAGCAAARRAPAASRRHLSCRVAVVGTGPSGFYTAKYLIKEDPAVRVDLLDALPTPYGLVRSGVAPDHPDVKSVVNDFEQVAGDPRVGFLGNVRLGADVSLDELRGLYDGVVLAYGAASDRALGVPGEQLDGVLSARAFVGWYNGHPDFRHLAPRLDVEDVVVVGQGNVAIDCARILTKTVNELKTTDIAAHALDALSKSKVKRVHVIGRRGHVQAAFTMKELREVTRLEDARFVVHREELGRGLGDSSKQEIEEHRAKKRMDELLAKSADAPADGKSKALALRFLLAPLRLVESTERPGAVGALECGVTALEGPPNRQRAVLTGAVETLPAGLVLRSIGYKSVAVPGLPFDEARSVVRNAAGRVHGEDGTALRGLYVAGWLKRGPSGIIGTNIPDARETVECLLQDLRSGQLGSGAAPAGGMAGLRALLASRGRQPASLVAWRGYMDGINAAEVSAGAAVGKPREKITDVGALLAAAQQAPAANLT